MAKDITHRRALAKTLPPFQGFAKCHLGLATSEPVDLITSALNYTDRDVWVSVERVPPLGESLESRPKVACVKVHHLGPSTESPVDLVEEIRCWVIRGRIGAD